MAKVRRAKDLNKTYSIIIQKVYTISNCFFSLFVLLIGKRRYFKLTEQKAKNVQKIYNMDIKDWYGEFNSYYSL